MSKAKLTPDLFLSCRLNSSDKDYSAIVATIDKYPSRNRAIIAALRLLARVPVPNQATSEIESAPNDLTAQFEIVNERLSLIIDKINFLQAAGFSPQMINAAMGDTTENLDPALQDEIRQQFLANNGG